MTAAAVGDGREPTRQALLPDPATLWGVVRRRWLAFVLAATLVGALVAAYLLTATPTYRATATAVIEPRRMTVVTSSNANAAVPPDAPPSTDEVDTEARVLGSAAIAGRVAAALHLEGYPEYAGAGPLAYDPAQPSTHPLAQALLRHVTARRAGLTYVIDVTASARDPVLAARIANGFVAAYLADRTAARAAATRDAGAFLTGRLEQLRGDAVAADAALQRYKVAHGLMSAQGATMAEQEVSELNAEIAKARADGAEKAGRLAAARAQIDRGSAGADTQTALQSPTVAELRGKEAETSRHLADLEAHYGDLYPDVVRTRQDLADIRRQIATELDRITSSLRAEAGIAASRLGSLEASRARASGALAANGVAQIDLAELQRRAEVAGAIYQAYLNRSKEAISREGLAEHDARIGALSRVPRLPASPDVPLVVLFGVLGAVVAGLAAMLASEYLDGGVATRADVERGLRVRYLGAVPELPDTVAGLRHGEAPEDYLVSHPASAFAEAFRALRAALATDGRGPHVVAVTSALPREGKSTTAIALARSYAGAGLRTVLLDGDVRRRTASELLLAPGSDGLLRYLAGEASLDRAVAADGVAGLMILGTTVAAASGRDLLSEAAVARLVDELRARFDAVVIDTAPVLALAEARSLARAADAVVMVARWRRSARRAVDTAIGLLLEAGAPLKGVALTRVELSRVAGLGGGEDVYAYHKKFAGYYVD